MPLIGEILVPIYTMPMNTYLQIVADSIIQESMWNFTGIYFTNLVTSSNFI